ncbi:MULTISPECIES: AAA family ATPase [Halomicrobium]|uniref:ATPase associated with various cellular activities AAA_3 n=2 Tax=Halomicrobium mukohataei TaxID=57705 RepID=C7NVR8_HALMD|nr:MULTISPECIES: MoxR family ATPase [Halomicrobium]ACV46183.1 ATPase associated with various cellular activities AAA_3 [Halomicrobium mukohataei DSM 12286]QCD64751.1 MoxR family ATPase [Halomicrobium mukohataei]QFR19558.1 AAA domain-containing protein [Halomicrobium sp. ZPS1]
MNVTEASDVCSRVLDEIGSAVIGERAFFETVLLGVVGRGHVLLEDVPGTGKTLTAQTMAQTLGLSFSRIQFTPDLLPADITGTHVFDERERSFEFNEGPIFANVVLADEINRAPPKTQSALLEAMEEGQVTVDGDTYELPRPFFVIATQNPVEMEGTFELPEAQVDRFLAKTSIGYPDEDGEFELLQRRAGRVEQSPSVETVLSPEDVDELRALPESITVEDDVLRYVSNVARATREHRHVDVGVSPRGTQRLFEAVRARALIRGREFVTPDDVKAVAQPVLAHRVVLTPEARVENVAEAAVVESVLDDVPVPTVARQ